jgi:pimeloyl-ACP methyl ester carboxylesterase
MMLRRTALLTLALIAVFAPFARAQAPADDKFFDSKGVKIRYVDVGRGEPVVLIHGFSSSIEANWGQTRVIDALARDYRVVAFDVRGHGKSDKPHDPASYGLNVVEDVTRLMDHLHLAKAHIVGYSMGGAIAGKFIVLHPERAISAVFGGSAPRVNWPAQAEKDARELAESLEQGHGMRPLILRLAPPNEPKPSDETIEQQSRAILGRNDPLALAAVQRGNKDQAVTIFEVRALKMPLLAVVGSADPIKAAVDTLKTFKSDLNVVVIDGATHSGPRGAPGRPEFVAAVRDFLTAHRSASDR